MFLTFNRERHDDKQVLALRSHCSAYDNAQIIPGEIPTINHFNMRNQNCETTANSLAHFVNLDTLNLSSNVRHLDTAVLFNLFWNTHNCYKILHMNVCQKLFLFRSNFKCYLENHLLSRDVKWF